MPEALLGSFISNLAIHIVALQLTEFHLIALEFSVTAAGFWEQNLHCKLSWFTEGYCVMKEGSVLKRAPVKQIRELQGISLLGTEPRNDQYLYRKMLFI